MRGLTTAVVSTAHRGTKTGEVDISSVQRSAMEVDVRTLAIKLAAVACFTNAASSIRDRHSGR